MNFKLTDFDGLRINPFMTRGPFYDGGIFSTTEFIETSAPVLLPCLASEDLLTFITAEDGTFIAQE